MRVLYPGFRTVTSIAFGPRGNVYAAGMTPSWSSRVIGGLAVGCIEPPLTANELRDMRSILPTEWLERGCPARR